jgi:hypothetical protein
MRCAAKRPVQKGPVTGGTPDRQPSRSEVLRTLVKGALGDAYYRLWPDDQGSSAGEDALVATAPPRSAYCKRRVAIARRGKRTPAARGSQRMPAYMRPLKRDVKRRGCGHVSSSRRWTVQFLQPAAPLGPPHVLMITQLRLRA